MFGINNTKTVFVPNGVFNLRNELVAKLNRAASDVIAFDYAEYLRLSRLATELSTTTCRTIADVQVYAIRGGADFAIETETVRRLSAV